VLDDLGDDKPLLPHEGLMATDTAAFSQSLIARKGVIGEVTPTAGAFRWSRPKPDVPPMMTSTTVAVESDASPHQSSTPS